VDAYPPLRFDKGCTKDRVTPFPPLIGEPDLRRFPLPMGNICGLFCYPHLVLSEGRPLPLVVTWESKSRHSFCLSFVLPSNIPSGVCLLSLTQAYPPYPPPHAICSPMSIVLAIVARRVVPFRHRPFSRLVRYIPWRYPFPPNGVMHFLRAPSSGLSTFSFAYVTCVYDSYPAP